MHPYYYKIKDTARRYAPHLRMELVYHVDTQHVEEILHVRVLDH
jgi:hypothetical protein